MFLSIQTFTFITPLLPNDTPLAIQNFKIPSKCEQVGFIHNSLGWLKISNEKFKPLQEKLTCSAYKRIQQINQICKTLSNESQLAAILYEKSYFKKDYTKVFAYNNYCQNNFSTPLKRKGTSIK